MSDELKPCPSCAAALREVSKYAREAGHWKGLYEGSTLCGVVKSWQDRCADLEAEIAALKEERTTK